MRETNDARRALAGIHNGLRDSGLNPLESLEVLSDLLLDPQNPPAGLDREASAVRRLMGGGAASASLLSIAMQEYLTDDLRAAFGQYLTPAPVASHVVELLDGKVSTGSTVLDPFAGSGILLDAAAARWPDGRFNGIEINQAVARVSRAVSSLAGHRVRVREADAFAEWFAGGIGRVDFIVANPPFGSRPAAPDKEAMERLGVAPALIGGKTVAAEVLALELCSSVLREGGLMSIVLPSSVLTNHRLAAFREDFFRRNELLHVTTLPEATFAPFRGVARSCVAVIRRGAAAGRGGFPVWNCLSVGYDSTGRHTGEPDLDVSALRSREATGEVKAGGVIAFAETPGATDGASSLGDIADVWRGRNPKRHEYTGEGPMLLKVGGLSGSFVSWRSRDRSHVPVEWFDKLGDRQLRVGDICLTATAHRPSYIGLKVDLIDELPKGGAAASGEVMVVRLKPDAPVTPVQLLFYLRSAEGYGALQSHIRGSTAHIYPRDVVDMKIPVSTEPNELAEKALQEAARFFRDYLRLEKEAYAAAGIAEDLAEGFIEP